jgi:predicted nucleic acid-binding protein
MPVAPQKYALDTNLFIDGFRMATANQELQRFHAAFAPFVYLHAVVAQELRAGTRSRADRDKLEREILDKFERLGRVVTPSTQCWNVAGDVLSELARAERLMPAQVSKAFLCDVLIAVSCRAAGVVLITSNTRDFQRIARHAPFSYVAPWPA